MATIDSHEASPSISRWSYHDVYISFRGEDTHSSFTVFLHRALFRDGLRIFSDHYGLTRGEDFESKHQKAIEQSRVSIIVISKNYICSRWCLEELVMIVKCISSGHLVLPVFYHVDPSEVWKQTGSIEEAFMTHERRIEAAWGEQKEYLKGKVEEWRKALQEVTYLAGFHITLDLYEAEIIQQVCFRVTELVTIKNRAHPGKQDWYDFSASHLEEERRRKRKKEEIPSHVFSLDILQQHFGSKRKDVAKSLGTSISTLKRHCRYHGIHRWPNRIRNNAAYSIIETARGSSERVFQMEGQTAQSTNREWISSHVFILDILQQHFGRKRGDVAKSLGISVSTLKRICRENGIHQWPNRIRNSVSGLPNPHGEKNPLPTFNTLSTNEQNTMENEVGGQNSEPNECLPGVYSETEAAGGSSEWVFQFEGQTTQSTAYPNNNVVVFPQTHIASEDMLNENGGSLEDRRDLLASKTEASFEGHVSESSNLMVLACSDAAAPSQPSAMMATVPDIIPHLTGGSSITFQLELDKEMGGQIPEPNELLLDFFQDTLIEIGRTPSFHDSFHSNYRDGFCFSSICNETGAAGGSSGWTFQPEDQTIQIPAYPIPDVLVSKPQIASIEVMNENIESSEDRRTLLASQEASQEEAFLEGHVFESSNLTVPAFSDAAAPSQPLPTSLHTMTTIPPMVPHHIGGSSECVFQLKNHLTQLPACPNLSGLVDPHPQIASMQIPSENTGTPEDSSIFLVSHEEPLLEECGFGSINQSAITSCLDPAASQQPMMPPLIASQDTRSVRVKATYGHTKIGFMLSSASGIIQLKEEVTKRLEFELGSFTLEYKDAVGDLMLIANDDDARYYLTSLGDQEGKLFVLDKVPNTTKFWESCGCDYCTLLKWKIPSH